MNSQKILITGANGFVGRHLIAHLLGSSESGASADLIVEASVLPSEMSTAIEWANGAGLPDWQDRLHWCELDIGGSETDAKRSVCQILERSQVEFVVHLAARASGADTDREGVFETNVAGTERLLSAVSETVGPAARVLLISTGYAYGNTSIQRPAIETDPLAPTGLYGAYTDSKIAMERVASAYGEIAIVARSFSHTGPGQTPVFAVPSFAKQLARIELGLESPEIRVGNLEAYRDMLDVRDVVRAYVSLVNEGVPGETYNVASGNPHRMRDILEQLQALISTRVEISTDPARLRPADIACSTGDTTRLRDRTGWQPRYTLSTTLNDTLNWWFVYEEGNGNR